ncbi:MAG: hypothetical protein IJC84_03110 [Clostridia bacterium]|nr:hypothetical protein [Clostridia bacterium]
MFVFVCWTPYQIFNAINFVLSDVEGARGNADIYIYHDFRNSEAFSRKLKDSGIFCHVYDVSIYDKRRKIWYSKFNKIKRLLMPYHTIRRYLRADIDVRKQGYKTLVVAGNNLFAINLYSCIKDLQVYFIDDGTGSYWGDIRQAGYTFLYRIFDRVFHRGPMSYDIKKLYINNKKTCRSTLCDTIVQLPALKPCSEVTEAAKKVFSYVDNPDYDSKRVIWLGEPMEEVSKNAPEREKQLLSTIADHTLVRAHPRQELACYEGLTLDRTNNLWELECALKIRDSHVLIGFFSTAQFTPKILFGKEPTVVFIYPLFGYDFPDGPQMIADLRSLYQDPGKVIVAETVEDLKGIIDDQ